MQFKFKTVVVVFFLLFYLVIASELSYQYSRGSSEFKTVLGKRLNSMDLNGIL